MGGGDVTGGAAAPTRAQPEGVAPDDAWLLERYKLFRSYLEHEDNLVNHRTTWFIQLHSFLIASYGLIFSSLVTIKLDRSIENVAASYFLAGLAAAVLVAITIIGLISAKTTQKSVIAAVKAIRELENDWDALLLGVAGPQFARGHKLYPSLPGLSGGGRKKSWRDGKSLAVRLPATLSYLWIVAIFLPLVALAIPPTALEAEESNICLLCQAPPLSASSSAE